MKKFINNQVIKVNGKYATIFSKVEQRAKDKDLYYVIRKWSGRKLDGFAAPELVAASGMVAV